MLKCNLSIHFTKSFRHITQCIEIGQSSKTLVDDEDSDLDTKKIHKIQEWNTGLDR